jgi:hypothetical protein
MFVGGVKTMKSFYSNFELSEIRKLAGKYHLIADNDFWHCNFKKMAKHCNGAGPAWLSLQYRKYLTEILKIYEPAFAIHDFDCGEEKISRTKADMRLLLNLFFIWFYCFKGKRLTKFAIYEACVIIPEIFRMVRCAKRIK